MKELLQSIFDSSNDRIKNPFIGSFATAFIIFNWRPIFLLLFSDAIIEDKIVVINNEYCNPSAITIPFIIAIGYVLLLPYVNLFFDWILSVYNDKNKERVNQSILNSLIQKKTEAKHEREIAEALAGTSEINTLKGQIETLNVENTNLSSQNKDAFDRYTNSVEMLKKQEDEMNQRITDIERQRKKISEYDRLIISEKNRDIEILARSVMSQFAADEIDFFKEFSDIDSQEFIKNLSFDMNVKYMHKFLDKGIIIFNPEDNIYELSLLGKTIYDSLFGAPF